jgi:hypothetical protein
MSQNLSTIASAFATGTVTAQGSASSTGGLVGVNQLDSSISDSFATGAVTGNVWVGGLVGVNQIDSTITNSFSANTVSGASSVGGLAGLNQIDAAIANSFYDSTVSGLSDVGKGVGLTTTQLRQLTTFSSQGWSIASCQDSTETTWGISASTTEYPFLVWANQSRLPSCSEAPTPSTRTPSNSKDVAEEEPTVLVAPRALPEPVVTPPPVTTEPVEPESTVDTDAPGDSEETTEVTASDTAIESEQLPSSSDLGWLWAIGLGGLATILLISGGVAWARMRA